MVLQEDRDFPVSLNKVFERNLEREIISMGIKNSQRQKTTLHKQTFGGEDVEEAL